MILNALKKHFFVIIIVLLTMLAIGGSYVKFVVTHDYIIYDEIECDPYTASCFLYCEDDACEEPFYYAELTRRADFYVEYCKDLDYFDCEASYGCMDGELNCQVNFCEDSADNECYSFSESDNMN